MEVLTWRKVIGGVSPSEGEERSMKPLPFVRFFEEDLGEVKLSPQQKKECLIAVGEGGAIGDPVKFYTRGTRPLEVYWVWGKGSGKGLLSSALQLYNIYMLHFLPNMDPYSYFGISKSVQLAIISVAMKEEQAQRILNIVKREIRNSKFFNRFPIMEERKLLNKDKFVRNLEPIKFSSYQISFTQIGVDFISVPSKNESFEGYTLIGWIMDEASGHVSEAKLLNAEKNYGTLTTSCRELPYLGIVTSFPRLDEKRDFTWGLYKEALKEMASELQKEDIEHYEENEEELLDKRSKSKKTFIGARYGSQFAVWYIKPKNFYSNETVEVYIRDFDLKLKVPKNVFDNLRKTRLKGQIAKFAALPIGYSEEERFVEFTSIDPYEHLIDRTLTPLISYNTAVVRRPEGLKFVIDTASMVLNRMPRRDVEYFLGVDLGETDCQTAVALGHGEVREDGKSFLIVDQIFLWRTDKEKGITIDSDNVYTVIRMLIQKLKIQKVKSDKWNTMFLKSGMPQWDDTSVTLQDYLAMKEMIFASPSRLVLPNCQESRIFIEELKNLGMNKGNAKPKVLVGYQDVLDAVAGLVFWFNKLFDVGYLGETIETYSPQGIIAVGSAGSPKKVEPTLLQIITPQIQPAIGIGSPGTGLPTGKSMVNKDDILKRFGF